MKTLPNLIKEILGFVLISVIVGISAQAVLPNGIGLKTEITIVGSDSNAVSIPSIKINPDGNLNSASNISLHDAYTAYQNEQALFFDARSQEEYQKAHILGAINLPVHAFMDSLPFLEDLNQELMLITYCDGADCNASIDLAADLKMMGFSRVFFFFGGWQEWQTAKYPMESSR